jgi:hypothetical protein
MTVTSRSRAALSCALLATTAFCGLAAAPAAAQAQAAPAARNLDPNGVDLTRGDYAFRFVEGTIGSGDGALSLVRTGMASHMWDNVYLQASTLASSLVLTAHFGDRSERFTAGQDPAEATGSQLVPVTGGYRHRSADGTIILFTNPTGSSSNNSQLCNGTQSQSDCRYVPTQIATPDGRTVTIDWTDDTTCVGEVGAGTDNCTTHGFRLDAISNSLGYRVAFSYALNGQGASSSPAGTAAPAPPSTTRRDPPRPWPASPTRRSPPTSSKSPTWRGASG